MRKLLIILLIVSFSYLHIGEAGAKSVQPKTPTKSKQVSTVKVVKKPIVKKTLPLKARDLKAKLAKVSRAESMADAILRRGAGVLGTPYSYGSTGNGSFDCSGFTSYAYKAAGIDLPHSSAGQASLGSLISQDSLQKGDLVIFNNSGNTRIGHVGIYIGDNSFIHASTNKGITVTSLDDSYYKERYVCARRLLK